MDIFFRPATENDVPLICKLAHKIWHEHYPSIITVEQIDHMLDTRYSPEVIATQIKNGEQYFLACVANEPLAYASVELKTDFYYLHKFYVDVSKHHTGIGTEFFEYLIKQIDNSKPIKLQVNRMNYKAVNFYFKMGFIIETVGDFNIGNNYYMNDFVMIRKAG